ncbi:MAG: hypothetical protein CMJ18_04540 [Phycisphaeraceae bacterium]|nr:hypothetical protein [Phycisphaeraceae bacterium]
MTRPPLALILIAPIAITAGCSAPREGSHDPEPDLTMVMKAKLRHSEGVLEGVVLQDFGKIRINATALYELSKLGAWKIDDATAYVQYSEGFQKLTEQLVQHADNRDAREAAETYGRMTTMCVNCHRYMHQQGLIPIPGGAMLKDAERRRLSAFLRAGKAL